MFNDYGFNPFYDMLEELKRDMEKDMAERNCEHSNKKSDKHTCENCKWCEMKDDTMNVCTNARWNKGNDGYVKVGFNDFCSFWEKRKKKNTFNEYEIAVLKAMKSIGMNVMTKVGNNIYFGKTMYSYNTIRFNNNNENMNVFRNLDKDDFFTIDDLLKG